MTIQTKFNIGDKVWVIENHKAIEIIINGIHVFIDKNQTKIKYFLDNRYFLAYQYYEDQVFATKQELLESL